MAVESAASNVDKPTAIEETKIGGRQPLSWPVIKNIVMMDTMMLKRV